MVKYLTYAWAVMMSFSRDLFVYLPEMRSRFSKPPRSLSNNVAGRHGVRAKCKKLADQPYSPVE